MVIIPKRINLVPQVADALRRAIRSQEWVERLPPENDLAAQLQVSRMTLRGGMSILVKERLIAVSKGRRALILPGRDAVKPARPGHLVGIIAPEEIATPPYGVYFRAFRDLLQEAGVRTRIYAGRRFYQRDPGKALEELTHESKADFWIVTMSNPGMQRWFRERRVPVLVDGSCQPGVVLPALDVDYRASCRHAAGTLLGLGHRRVVYLSVNSGAGGDAASEVGFAEGLGKFLGEGGRSGIVPVEESVPSVSAALGRLFRGENPPTALVCGRAGVTVTTLSYLLNRGLRVPRDVSLISRDTFPYLDCFIPAVARYSFKAEAYARRLARMTLKHFDGTLQAEQQFILPAFDPGQSIGPPPAAVPRRD